MRFSCPLIALILVALYASPARASVYTFAASCSDCTGLSSGTDLVTATLTLTGDVPGQPVTAANFVSFSYGGSDKAHAFMILATDGYPLSFTALFLDQASQFADVALQGVEDGGSGNGWNVTTGSDGTFDLAFTGTGSNGQASNVDMGSNAVWTLAGVATNVSESPSLTLLGVGLAAGIATSGRATPRGAARRR